MLLDKFLEKVKSLKGFEKAIFFTVLGLYAISLVFALSYSAPRYVPKDIAQFSKGAVTTYLLQATSYLLLFLYLFYYSSRKTIVLWSLICFSALSIVHNKNWVKYIDYKEEAKSDFLTTFLHAQKGKSRVTASIMPDKRGMLYQGKYKDVAGPLYNYYLETKFRYYGIQSLTIVQAPRFPELDRNYLEAFSMTGPADFYKGLRLWKLTNTRYLLGHERLLEELPYMGEGKFQVIAKMIPSPKIGVYQPTSLTELEFTLNKSTDADVALVWYEDALPRAKIYHNWEVLDPKSTLEKLVAKEFIPEETLLIDRKVNWAPSKTLSDNKNSAEVVEYNKKKVVISVDTEKAGLLLLNDKYSPRWGVTVNGEEKELIKANYLMRAVFVPTGNSKVVFYYKNKFMLQGISLTAIIGVIALVGFKYGKNFQSKRNNRENL